MIERDLSIHIHLLYQWESWKWLIKWVAHTKAPIIHTYITNIYIYRDGSVLATAMNQWVASWYIHNAIRICENRLLTPIGSPLFSSCLFFFLLLQSIHPWLKTTVILVQIEIVKKGIFLGFSNTFSFSLNLMVFMLGFVLFLMLFVFFDLNKSFVVVFCQCFLEHSAGFSYLPSCLKMARIFSFL